MAPIISADSSPSLNIIENEVENASVGAITPVPVTNLSDSSNPLLISTTLLQLLHIVDVVVSYCGARQILFPYQE